MLFRKFDQPPVIGEVVGGILLGPSLLGLVAPRLQAMLIPSEAVTPLGIMAQIGVLLYMFLVGLELDLQVLRGRTAATVAISTAGIVVPFALGAVLAWKICAARQDPAHR